MTNDREHLATLAAVLATKAKAPQTPIKAACDAIMLIRIGRQAHTLAVREYNGEGHWQFGQWTWDDADSAKATRRRAAMLKKAQAIANDYGATVEIGGDPRGYVMRLHFPDSKHRNSWGEVCVA